jgi:hypothetical protein
MPISVSRTLAYMTFYYQHSTWTMSRGTPDHGLARSALLWVWLSYTYYYHSE